MPMANKSAFKFLKIVNGLIFILKKLYFMGLEELYDGYGYKSNDKFVSMADLRKLKYPPVKRVPQKYTEIGSFISNAGEPVVDLVWPIIGEVNE
jgi:hypothetical protein